MNLKKPTYRFLEKGDINITYLHKLCATNRIETIQTAFYMQLSILVYLFMFGIGECIFILFLEQNRRVK